MTHRFQAALSALPSTFQPILAPLLAQPHFNAELCASTVDELLTASGLDENRLALSLLPLAAACAYAPISHFNVGAIAHGESGTLYFGANLEFPGTTMQQAVHAEQSAITHAWMRGERRLRAITVNYTPCGHCRQFMNELNSGTGLIIQLPTREAATLGDYLPEAFGPRDLAIQTLLMNPQNHDFICEGDALTQAAISAANCSHAPYSKAYAGLALQMNDGVIFSGSYAENAAYNPSLPPLQAALNLMYLHGYHHKDIVRAILAQKTDAALNQWDATRATLWALGCDALHQHALN